MGTVSSCSLMDGVLAVNKEAGWTSHDVVAKLRHLLGQTKVGHAGTLDPAATGVLPVLIGKGTRIAEYLVEWDKEYRAVLRLGEATDTQDATGTVLARESTERVTADAIREAAGRFRGAVLQVPPMYSAVKVAGVPLYKAARAGRTVVREPRTVHIHALDVLAIDGRDVMLSIVCSKGTYIRTLCADIGAALGVGGHMLSLERRRVGPLTIERALTVDETAARHALSRLGDSLMSLDQALDGLPALVVNRQTAERVRHGVPVPASEVIRWERVADGVYERGAPTRIHDVEGRLLAIGMQSERQDSIKIEKVLIGQD